MTFDIVSPETIRSGGGTDAYFDRTMAALEHAGRNPDVVAEVTADQFPTGEFEVIAGVKDAAHLLSEREIDVVSLREGQLFDGGPVMRIEGPYREFCRLETALLGFLSPASGIATNALQAARAAGETPVLSFGSRHVHPAVAATVERSALIGGLDGFSNVAAGEIIGREPSGTMPHSLMICFGEGNQEAAWRAFDESAPEDVPRIALCDTYGDETQEALRAAELGVDGVRLDTTSSRRGDFGHIAREVRWELANRGFEDVDLFLSGGLGPADLRDLRHLADGFGVGAHVANAEPVDFALDVVAVDGAPAAKRGKLSGRKAVYRTANGGHHVQPAHRPGPEDAEPLLAPLVADGDVVRDFDLDAAAERARTDAEMVEFDRAD